MLTITLGTAVRRASATGMPFDSWARSIAGKASSPTGETGGAVRFGPAAIFGAGRLRSGTGGGVTASSPQPPMESPFSVRVPGVTDSANTGRVSQRCSAARTSAGVTAAMRARSVLYLAGSPE